MRLTVPTLRDDVIALRPPEPGDVEAITAAVQDPDIPRFTMVPSPYAAADAAAWIERSAAHWQEGRDASFVIVDRARGTLLGAIGLHDFDDAARRATVGYWVDASARGRGVATRALRLVAAWALDEDGVGLRHLHLQVFTDNERSGGVAGRAGFVRVGVSPVPLQHRLGLRQVVVYARLADDPPVSARPRRLRTRS